MTIPVSKVNGIGPKTTEYLKSKNITTVAGLVKYGVANLALAPGFSSGRATTAINEAEKLIGGKSVSSSSASTKNTASVNSKNKKSDKKNKKNKDKKNKKAKKDKKKDKKKNKKNKKDKK